MSREELQTALSPSVLSIERYYSQVKADKEYTESIIEEKLRAFIEGIDTNAIIRNILYSFCSLYKGLFDWILNT